MDFSRTRDGCILKGNQPVLLKGAGLGGWLLPEGYMWRLYNKCDRPRRIEQLVYNLCGETYARFFWKDYRDNYITREDIVWMALQGLNSVRLPFNARHLFKIDLDGQPSFNSEVLQYVDSCLAWCQEHQLYLFLDMHAAPGGQTGQNIDDNEADVPELFLRPEYQDQVVSMWRLIAQRYAHEPAIGGYDLLNEPLPKWQSQHNWQLLPLYRRIIKAIRSVDSSHIIVLEGAHWATDFSIFEGFTREEAADQIILSFHKYWSDPDKESLSDYLEWSRKLNAPLWMGEGGENNLNWYTYMFPLYEKLNIGWNFWSYKKSPNTSSSSESSDKCSAFPGNF